MKMPEEVVFELSNELIYQSGGDQITSELMISAPIGKHERYVCQLQQKLMRAMLEVSKSVQSSNQKDSSADSQDGGMTKESVLIALRGGCEDLFGFKQTFYKMICEGLCYINGPSGKVNMTLTLLGDLSLSDKDNLVGEYIANFIQLS